MYREVNKILGTKYSSDKKINWLDISRFYKLEESFIDEFKDYIDWNYISFYQPLTENFIRKYKDKVKWGSISSNQILSWDFILEFKDRVNWNYISLYQPYVDKNNSNIRKDNLIHNDNFQLYQKTKEQGWFIGVIYYFSLGGYVLGYLGKEWKFSESSKISVYTKAKIYWRDLIKINEVKYYEPIRLYKYV